MCESFSSSSSKSYITYVNVCVRLIIRHPTAKLYISYRVKNVMLNIEFCLYHDTIAITYLNALGKVSQHNIQINQ